MPLRVCVTCSVLGYLNRGTSVRLSLLGHNCQRNLASTQAVGNELYHAVGCPSDDAIWAVYSNLILLIPDAEGFNSMFMWHKYLMDISHAFSFSAKAT